MAEANESQGLKIAVAVFITVSVMLAVTSYFLYSNTTIVEAKLNFERDAHKKTRHAADLALTQYEEMRTRVGTKAEAFDPAMEEIAANFRNVEERLDNLINAVNAAVQTAEQNRARGPELEDAKLNIQKAIASYRSQPNKNYVSSLDRLTEAMENLALLTTQLSLKYVGVRKSREEATSVVKGQKDQGPTAKD